MTDRERFEKVFPVPQGAEKAVIEKALWQAFSLGQAYWQQADSESCSQNRKSGETLQKFNSLVTETLNNISGAATQQASPQGVDKEYPSPTKGMNLGERIKHVGGRENEAGYIEFGSVMAVHALINHVLRDVLPIPDTHQIMPVKLTDALIKAALPQLMREDDEDKYRALGQLICVWDALVEAAKDEECQS